MQIVSLIGRILFGGFFLFNGINHFTDLQSMTAYAGSKGVPMPSVAVIVSGLLLLAGGALILLGYKPRAGAWAIVVFLVPVTFMMHQFWGIDDPQQRMSEMINFMKNMALLGAALMIATISYWPLSLEKSGEEAPDGSESA
ncbi:MAG: DoxX family protein [Thermoanaerobaculia bacterium]|nr:DoxX family protein [Thermoanaerobaculia bacterium]